MNVLSIDYGSKRVGIASGDSSLGIGFARCVIPNEGINALLKKVLELMDEYNCKKVVLGLPLNDGEENPLMEDVKKFLLALKEADVDVEMFDETLSSFEADNLMEDIKSKNPKAMLGRDAYAALVILQRFFEKSF